MEAIINVLADEFKNKITNFLKTEKNPTIEVAESALLGMALEFTAQSLSALYEAKDKELSHILSSRLSTRPMAWSRKTLEHIAPILAAGACTLEKPSEKEPHIICCTRANCIPKHAKTADNSLGLPDPDHATDIAGSFKGHLSGLYGILRPLCGFSKSYYSGNKLTGEVSFYRT